MIAFGVVVQARFCVKYRHCDGALVLKITDDKTVSSYVPTNLLLWLTGVLSSGPEWWLLVVEWLLEKVQGPRAQYSSPVIM